MKGNFIAFLHAAGLRHTRIVPQSSGFITACLHSCFSKSSLRSLSSYVINPDDRIWACQQAPLPAAPVAGHSRPPPAAFSW